MTGQMPLLALVHNVAAPPEAFLERFVLGDRYLPCDGCGKPTRSRMRMDRLEPPWCTGCWQEFEKHPLRLVHGGAPRCTSARRSASGISPGSDSKSDRAMPDPGVRTDGGGAA